jgi:hypothetical protein
MTDEGEKEIAKDVQRAIMRAAPSVDELLKQGVRQLSRKYRTVARLPPGMTGLQALQERAPERYKEVMKRAEEWAAEDYCRYVAEKYGDHFELTVEQFNEYLAKTGRRPNTFLEQDNLQQCPHCKTLGHQHAPQGPGDPRRSTSIVAT